MSLRGISAQYSGVDGSAESILQWISFLQEECLVVFDNADVPPLEVVEKFIPHGNRGNIIIISRIENKEIEEADAITLLLRAIWICYNFTT